MNIVKNAIVAALVAAFAVGCVTTDKGSARAAGADTRMERLNAHDRR